MRLGVLTMLTIAPIINERVGISSQSNRSIKNYRYPREVLEVLVEFRSARAPASGTDGGVARIRTGDHADPNRVSYQA